MSIAVSWEGWLVTTGQSPPVQAGDRVDDCLLLGPLAGWDAGRAWRAAMQARSDNQTRDVIVQFRGFVDRPHASDIRDFAAHYAELSHPGLCRLRATSIEPMLGGREDGKPRTVLDGWLAVTCDPITGLSLGDWIVANVTAGAVERLAILRMVASALDLLHTAGLAHGNVRADSIVVTDEAAAILLPPEFVGDTRLAERQAADRDEFLELTVETLTGERVPRSPDTSVDVPALRQLLFTSPATYRRAGLGARLLTELTAPAETRTRQLRSWLDSAGSEGSSATVTGPAALAAPANAPTDLEWHSGKPAARIRRLRFSFVASSVAITLVAIGLAVFQPWTSRNSDHGASNSAPVAVAATWLGTDCTTAVAMPAQAGSPSTYGDDPRAKVLEAGGAIWHTGELTVSLRNTSGTNILLTGVVPHRVGNPSVTPPAWIFRPKAASCGNVRPPVGPTRHYTMDLSNLNSLRADDATPASVIGNPLEIPAGETATLGMSVTTCTDNFQFQFRFVTVVEGSSTPDTEVFPPVGSGLTYYAMDGFAQNTIVYSGSDPNPTPFNGHDPECGTGSS